MEVQPANGTAKVYNFRRQIDEGDEIVLRDIGMVCRFVQSEILDSRKRYSGIARDAGCCPATVSKLAHGETKMPRFQTILAILNVLGFEVMVRR